MKTAVITGAGRGIGLATAKHFLENGWKVVGTYRGEPAPIEAPDLTQVPLDLTDEQSIASAIEAITRAAPRIDVLVNNAGILIDGASEAIEMDKVKATFAVNVFGLIDLTERLIPFMHEGSHILNLDSGHGAMSDPIKDGTSSAYRISKAAVNMYTRVAAFHLKGKGIVVSSIAPGWVRTAMGMSIASGAEQPDRDPADAAKDIYDLAISNPETGCFWEYGKKRPW